MTTPAAPERHSAAQRMAEGLLRIDGEDLYAVIEAARDKGQSYERIARDLYQRSDGAIDVASGTVRNWHRFYRAQRGAT